MKIAVPTRDGQIDDHFGHCAYYTIFDIEDNQIVSTSRLNSPEGCGCKSNIASEMEAMGISVMLAGNMGQGAKNKQAAPDEIQCFVFHSAGSFAFGYIFIVPQNSPFGKRKKVWTVGIPSGIIIIE